MDIHRLWPLIRKATEDNTLWLSRLETVSSARPAVRGETKRQLMLSRERERERPVLCCAVDCCYWVWPSQNTALHWLSPAPADRVGTSPTSEDTLLWPPRGDPGNYLRWSHLSNISHFWTGLQNHEQICGKWKEISCLDNRKYPC